MNDHEADQIFKLLQQIEMRIARIENTLSKKDELAQISYDDPDPLLPTAIDVAYRQKKVSASLLQRYLQIGYARADRIMRQMEKEDIVGLSYEDAPREVDIDKAKAFLSDPKKTGLMNDDIS